MERVEPKVGDRLLHGSQITTIEGFDEDHGTYLRSGLWVCMSDFEKNEDGVWVKESSQVRVFRIEAEKRREGLESALKRHGVEVWRKEQPVPVLERLLAVLEEADEG